MDAALVEPVAQGTRLSVDMVMTYHKKKGTQRQESSINAEAAGIALRPRLLRVGEGVLAVHSLRDQYVRRGAHDLTRGLLTWLLCSRRSRRPEHCAGLRRHPQICDSRRMRGPLMALWTISSR